ncbi:hypothetical protein LLEC1_02189 [Akanthomyces lecanii]|uniref:Uncharacterized protein n=1 Tax=Cordyceps confragosa TaxID=2714763 RepID=A0A179IS04_CORDF|nr:hypothetical protein LLEC1_02189 [Akanthomyces lecanii]
MTGVCFLGGKDYGPCCDDGICAGSRCRDPKTLTSTEPTPTAEPSCVPYDGVCFLGGKDYGPCCGDGICAGSRCRDPKTIGAQPTA